MHCIILILALYALDQGHAESESEVQVEQVQVKAITNLALDQSKPRFI
jgi:hypothetical protein